MLERSHLKSIWGIIGILLSNYFVSWGSIAIFLQDQWVEVHNYCFTHNMCYFCWYPISLSHLFWDRGSRLRIRKKKLNMLWRKTKGRSLGCGCGDLGDAQYVCVHFGWMSQGHTFGACDGDSGCLAWWPKEVSTWIVLNLHHLPIRGIWCWFGE
jgi:hypothetical protein